MRAFIVATAVASFGAAAVSAQTTNPNQAAYDQCYNDWIACKQSPDPNQSYCASQVEGCYSKADNACRTAPDANQSYCSSLYSEYYGKTGITPPQERVMQRQTQEPNRAAYEQCYNDWIACKQAPDPNQSFCASQVEGCFSDADNACRTAPEANQSYCSSLNAEYYDKTGITPPQQQAVERQAEEDPNREAYEECYEDWTECSTAPDANHSYCGSQVGGCFAKADNACRTAENANQSYCASLYAEYYGKTGITPPNRRTAKAFRA